MAGLPIIRRSGWIAAGFGFGLGLGLGADGTAIADRIAIRGGGQIRGKVLPDPKDRDRVAVLMESGKAPLSFRKTQILEVVAEPTALDEYVGRRDRAGSTAEAEYDLGAWCEANKLHDLATLHYEAALARDKGFAPAHQKLGHVLSGEVWLTGDEVREAQGLVRYKGKWISRAERDRREEALAESATQATWQRRIRLLCRAIDAESSERGRKAQEELLEIRDPAAVAPLVRVLGDAAAAYRMLLDEVLGAIPGPEASRALVYRILAETDAEVRNATLTELGKREADAVLPGLVKALRASEPMVVNRAAWTLGHLDAVAAVPRLVPALVTTQTRVVLSGGGNPTGPSPFATGSGPSVPIYANGSTVGYLTPPAVGPGVVAYGATQSSLLPSSTAALTSGANAGPRGPVPRLLTYTYQNVEVLAALVRLTGRDFGYDVPTWSRWVATSFRVDRKPAKQVPQP